MHACDRCFDLGAAAAGLGHAYRLTHDRLVADRRRAAVDHLDVEVRQGGASLGRRGVGAAEIRGDSGAHDRIAFPAYLAEDRFELGRGGLRRTRMQCGGAHSSIEGGRVDGDPVLEHLLAEDDFKRHHAQVVGGAEAGVEVGGAVADDVHGSHDAAKA